MRQDFPTDGCLHRAFNRTGSRERGPETVKGQRLSKMPTAEGEATMGTCPGNHVQAFVPSRSSLTSEYYFPERSTSGLKDSPRTVHNRSAGAEPRGAKERARTNRVLKNAAGAESVLRGLHCWRGANPSTRTRAVGPETLV